MPQSQLKKSAELLARTLDNSAGVVHARHNGLRVFETLALMVGAELIRTVSPMRLAGAIQKAQKKFESLVTEGESNTTVNGGNHNVEENNQR